MPQSSLRFSCTDTISNCCHFRWYLVAKDVAFHKKYVPLILISPSSNFSFASLLSRKREELQKRGETSRQSRGLYHLYLFLSLSLTLHTHCHHCCSGHSGSVSGNNFFHQVCSTTSIHFRDRVNCVRVTRNDPTACWNSQYTKAVPATRTVKYTAL